MILGVLDVPHTRSERWCKRFGAVLAFFKITIPHDVALTPRGGHQHPGRWRACPCSPQRPPPAEIFTSIRRFSSVSIDVTSSSSARLARPTCRICWRTPPATGVSAAVVLSRIALILTSRCSISMHVEGIALDTWTVLARRDFVRWVLCVGSASVRRWAGGSRIYVTCIK